MSCTKIYNIENGEISESYSDSNHNYQSVYFNPYNPNQLFLTVNDDKPVIEIRDPSNFSLLDKIDLPCGMIIQNIDPETSNILLTDYKNIFIINIETHEILLKIPCDEYKIWLFNNNLFTDTGYALNISEYL